jgi:hypothetical protein
LRGSFPYLVVAAMPYFGKRTEKEINVLVPEYDPRLDAIKR